MRGESVPGRRVEVLTEGVLTRMLQADPALDGVSCVVFDEFHERSLQGDLGLALVLELQQVLREDLRVLVMSATLDGARFAALFLARARWRGEALAPFLADVAVDAKERDRLLLKHARALTDADGIWYTARAKFGG